MMLREAWKCATMQQLLKWNMCKYNNTPIVGFTDIFLLNERIWYTVHMLKSHERISIRFHHGLDVKHFSCKVVRPSPWWWQEDHIPAETGCQLKEVSLHKVDSVSNMVNCGIVPGQVQPHRIDINGQDWEPVEEKDSDYTVFTFVSYMYVQGWWHF